MKTYESGAEKMVELAKQGHSVLVAPNHGDHADPHVMVENGSGYGLSYHFMSARECFEVSRTSAFVLQRMGAFSVDREGTDLSSIKTAIKILSAGEFPLVIFPEGEIWHHQEMILDLNDGVSAIAIKSLKKMKEGKRCYVVPVGLRYTNDTEIVNSFSERLNVLEDRIGWKPRPNIPVVERIWRLATGILATKEAEFLGRAQDGTLQERIQKLQRNLIALVEDASGYAAGEGNTPQQVKKLRQLIREELICEEKPPDPERQGILYDFLDTLFLCIQLYSYPQYLSEDSSVDRIAETIFKLEEDVLGEGLYLASREVHIEYGEPIDVLSFIEEEDYSPKSAVSPLTQRMQAEINRLMHKLTQKLEA